MRNLAFRGLRLPRLGAMRSGSAFTSSVPLLLTRSTAAWAQDLSGNLIAFGVNQRRLTSAGLTITGAATRLHGEAPTNATNQSITPTTLPAEGLFNPMRAASTGGAWNRRQTLTFALTNGTPVYIRARVRAGTSGRFRVVCRNEIAITESILGGVFATPTVFASAAGTITDVVNKLLPNGDREFTLTWTPNATAASAVVGIGPDSATSGQTIDIIGMQVTSQFSEWIMGGAGTVAQAADVATLDLTGVSMAAGFMLRMDGTLLATPRMSFDRFYQADNGDNNNRITAYITPATGVWASEQNVAGDGGQGSVTLKTAVVAPVAFSFVGAHATNYIGGAADGVVGTPDTIAGYITPTFVRIGASISGGSALTLLLTRITLFPETPTTPRVTEVAA